MPFLSESRVSVTPHAGRDRPRLRAQPPRAASGCSLRDRALSAAWGRWASALGRGRLVPLPRAPPAPRPILLFARMIYYYYYYYLSLQGRTRSDWCLAQSRHSLNTVRVRIHVRGGCQAPGPRSPAPHAVPGALARTRGRRQSCRWPAADHQGLIPSTKNQFYV